MASDYLVVGSEGLTELKNELTNLSKTLHELYELMNADMRQVGEEWRDGKYEEFVQGYKPQINKCEEISERYSEWCKMVLDPAIEECIDIEKSDMGGDGASSSGGGNSGGMLGANGNNQSDQPSTAQIFKWKKDSDSGPDSGSRSIGTNKSQKYSSDFMRLFKQNQR